MRFYNKMRRWFFKSMAALLMVSLGAGTPGVEALNAARYQLFMDKPQTVFPAKGPACVLAGCLVEKKTHVSVSLKKQGRIGPDAVFPMSNKK